MSRKKTNKIEAETGEVIQSNRPFIIRNGGVAKPLGQGLYLLGGKTHEQGGIDIDFTGDARIFSAQPILNGNSPAELVARGANPSITFNRQERFKDVNRINDDGSRKKAENGKEVKVVPTREEYIAGKIDSTINNSLRRSLNKTVPDLVYVPITDSNYSSANAEIEFEKNNINKFSSEAAKAANNGDYDSYYKYMNDAQISSARLNRLTSLWDKGLCEGPNCIYNATKNYGDEYATTGNYTFAENHNKKGFIKIDSSSKRPGDIVQVVNDWNNAPSHAMTYYRTDENGVDRFNYSNGNSNKQAIRKDGKYPVGKGIRLDYYRFVGTPQDSIRLTNEYNKLYMNNSNKKRLGGSTGLIRVQANGKDRLMYVPFTGEGTKANRKKARYGLYNSYEDYLKDMAKKYNGYSITDPSKLTDVQKANIDWMHQNLNRTIIDPFNADIDPTISIPNRLKRQENKTLLSIEQIKANSDLAKISLGNYSDINKGIKVPEITNKQVKQQTKAALKKEGLDWVSRNKDWAAPAISALSNGLAGLLSYRINKNMLGDIKYTDKPIPKIANPLITRVNVEPKLTNLRENLARSIENITANSSSSKVSQSRINDMALNTTLAMNAIYADKENQERDLINRSRLNQQEVANANIDAYNTWRTGKTNFENTIREQLSENAVSLVDNINKGIQTGITDAERRRQFRNNLAVMAAAYPNVTPELLRTYGADFLRMGGKVKLNKKK